MRANKNQILLTHAQRYIRATMAEHLRKEGFVSKNGDDIHWYRIVNNEVVQSVLFHTRHTALPLFLDIGYGCHPLFLQPAFPKDLYIYAMTDGLEVFNPGFQLMKLNVPTRFTYDKDCMVSCPDDAFCGADILDKVLDVFKKAVTAEECYQFHKRTYILGHQYAVTRDPCAQPYSRCSIDFMDEVVYWNDREVIPFCCNTIGAWLSHLEHQQGIRKLMKFEINQIERLKHLDKALNGGDRIAHMQYLEQQKNRTLNLLKKKTGLALQNWSYLPNYKSSITGDVTM